jgi:hypothetical protein
MRFLIILIAYLVASSNTICYANNLSPEFISIDYQYDRYIPNIVESSSYNHRAKRIAMNLGKNFKKHLRFETEIVSSIYRSTPKRNNEKSYITNDLGVNVVGIYHTGNRTWLFDPYLGFMAGLSYLKHHGDQPNWGNSGVLGTWGAVLGMTITVKNVDVKTELRFTHTSDPFDCDSGRNFEGIVIGIVYYFK